MNRNVAIGGLLAIGLAAGAAAFLTVPSQKPGVSEEEAQTWALSVNVPFAELEIPDNSRPQGAPPLDIPLNAGWEPFEARRKLGQDYRHVNPIRPRGLYTSKSPEGSRLVDGDGNEVLHRQFSRTPPYWTFNKEHIQVHLPEGVEPGEGWTLRYPPAIEREAKLNYEFAAADDREDFVRSQIQAGPVSLQGLLLPAPARAAFDVQVPKMAVLRFEPGLVNPEILDAPRSDGVTLRVELEAAGTTTELWSDLLTRPVFEPVELDLSKWAGKDVRIRFVSDPGENATFDYAFVGEPVLTSIKRNPRRVVLVFVDTLRPDHLGAYGYHRDTSPGLDALASEGVVFENARSVAPWTLPSARSLVTGRHPEYYDVADTLQATLREKGWATAMWAGNMYLAPNFQMNKDWGRQHVVLTPFAKKQMAWFDRWQESHAGQDSLVLLHFMDAHIPYKEPEEWRHLWAGEDDSLPEHFARYHVLRTRPQGATRQYIQDRYDNNIRYVDDQLAPLFESLDENDVVVYFSDHGEEFWEHGGYEHGHTLFDEVLRVPLVIRAPGMPAGRVTEPVSLLDIVPTVLDLVGAEMDDLDGTSLVPAAQGDEAALTALADRPQAFGRPLYGFERWGVLTDDKKYFTREGRERLFDLSADPLERDDLFLREGGDAGAPYREAMSEALGRDARVAYRLQPTYSRTHPEHDLVARISVPGGVEAAWVGDDPTQHSAARVEVEGDTAVATWISHFRGSREVYVVPTAPFEEVTHELEITMSYGDQTSTITVPESVSATMGTVRAPMARTAIGQRQVQLTWGIAPVPDEDVQALDATDAELSSMLEAMGYVFDDEGDEADDDDDGEEDGTASDGTDSPSDP